MSELQPRSHQVSENTIETAARREEAQGSAEPILKIGKALQQSEDPARQHAGALLEDSDEKLQQEREPDF